MTDQILLDRRRFVQAAGAVAGAAALTTVVPAPRAHASELPPGASAFEPLASPWRVLDTRYSTDGFVRLADTRIRVPLRGQYGVPGTATAVVATLTGVNYGVGNWAAVFPSGAEIPRVSNLNLVEPGLEANANLVTVKIGQDGAVDIASRVPCDLIFDVLGYYEPIDGAVKAGRYIGLASATRVLDTRPTEGAPGPKGEIGAEQTLEVDLSSVVPADASAAMINLTATQTGGPGYATVFPYALADRPASSSLNWNGANATRASAVIAQVDNADGKRRIKVFVKSATHLIVDVTGYYTSDNTPTASTVGAFVPLDPVRILDTRAPEHKDPQTPAGVLWPRWQREVAIPGAAAGAASVLVNLTGTQSRGPGYLTVYPAWNPRPGTSNLNFSKPNATVPNHAITTISSRGLEVFTSHGSAIVVDLNGYFTGPQAPLRVVPEGNPPPPPIGVPWTLTIPGLGVQIPVVDGNADAVTNAGLGWHWTGTGNVGEAANLSIFAHRTEAAGPFLHLQYLEAGHEWWLDTVDGRRYVYVMTRRDLTDAQNENILDATRFEAAPSCSLIACTVGFDSTKSRYPDRWAPTSTKYRIIVTGRLDRWFAII